MAIAGEKAQQFVLDAGLIRLVAELLPLTANKLSHERKTLVAVTKQMLLVVKQACSSACVTLFSMISSAILGESGQRIVLDAGLLFLGTVLLALSKADIEREVLMEAITRTIGGTDRGFQVDKPASAAVLSKSHAIGLCAAEYVGVWLRSAAVQRAESSRPMAPTRAGSLCLRPVCATASQRWPKSLR